MDRRTFIKTAAGAGAMGAVGGLAAPAIAQGAKVLKFVPQANLANFDPIWTTQYVVRNASQLVWDTLYGMDSKLQAKRQMVESEEVSSDGLTWTFKLRDGLKFHDGEKVTAKDCVASIARWSVRDGMGQMLAAIQKELVAVDDKTFKWVLSKPYPKMLLALGKVGTPCCFIMPERIAKTDPFKQIEEYVGSGPMKFVRGDWKPGALAAFEKFKDYVPRSEPTEWWSGGKTVNFDRIEWVIMPDPATASAALQSGEIDWWENPVVDLVPLLKKNKNIKVDIADPLGNIGSFRLNHMFPPFDNVLVRRAVQVALSQEDYMHALVGNDDKLWKPCPSFITPGTALYTEDGGEPLKGPRNIELAKKLLKDGGYSGQPVTCVVAQDQPITKAFGEITADLLKKIGMTVDFVATDWGTVGQRRASKSPPGQGGWGMFHTWHAGSDCASPVGYVALRTNGDKAWFGWPKNDQIEKGIADWYEAKSLDDEKKIIANVNKLSMEHVTYIPTGFFLGYQAWRTNLEGVSSGPLPWFWGPKKA
ncbi:MAG: ABC transporter substrate-binding protein [Proteobacteria bacterium]|nr:ABC transporter substrate-binding protein [Pseudomonadota bacterium]